MNINDQYNHILSILSKLNLDSTNWHLYSRNYLNITTESELDRLSLESDIGLSYKYLNNKLFILTIFSEDTIYQIKSSNINLTEALLKIETKVDRIYLWNSSHLSKFFKSSKYIDTQILNNIITNEKDGYLDVSSSYKKQVDVFLGRVYKSDEFYFCVPNSILYKSMSVDAISSVLYGKILYSICIKLDMISLFSRLSELSIVLSDINKNYIYVDPKKVLRLVKLKKPSKHLDALSKYIINNKTSKIPVEYRHLRSKTGRIIFDNKTGLSITTLPHTNIRECIIPEYDKFVSFDIKAAEVFYIFKTSTKILSDITVDDNFDLYNYLISKCSLANDRELVKETIIKWLYGSTSFNSDENLIIESLKSQYPELSHDNLGYIPEYYQTKYKRIIKLDNSLTKYLNNIPQSEFSDEMIDILCEIWRNLKLYNLRTKIKFIIYDEIIFDCPQDEIEIVKNIIKQCADKKFPYRVTEAENWFKVSKN